MQGPCETPSDANRQRCVLRLCSAVLDRGVTGRHPLTRNDSSDRMDWDETAPRGTYGHESIGLLIRWVR